MRNVVDDGRPIEEDDDGEEERDRPEPEDDLDLAEEVQQSCALGNRSQGCGSLLDLPFVGVLEPSVVWEVFWVNVALKGIVTLLSIPWIYLVRPAPLEGVERPDRAPLRSG